MNFDLYEFLKYHNGSKFYPVKVEEIDELEKKLNLIVPKELKDLLLGIGYGFIKGSENNVNRIMDTDSIRDFRLRKGDFEFYPDIEIYDEYEDGKLIFFEGSESALISIELTDDNEYSCAATPQIRQTGNRLSGLAETAYASLLAQCFV